MKRVLVIGVGAGGADLLTVQAIEALKRADVIFTFDKGAEKDDLVQLRKEICERYCDHKPYRLIEVPSPQRDPAAASYKAGVAVWHKARADIVKALIRDELPVRYLIVPCGRQPDRESAIGHAGFGNPHQPSRQIHPLHLQTPCPGSLPRHHRRLRSLLDSRGCQEGHRPRDWEILRCRLHHY